MKRQQLQLFATALLAIVFSVDTNAQKISFPSQRAQAKSPDGRYAISDEPPRDQASPNKLALVDLRSRKKRDFYEYQRHVEVLWSSRSNAFVVNDYAGSDMSTAVLFSLPLAETEIDLRPELERYLQSRHVARDPFGDHHMYLTVERWLNSRQLLCKLWGYGEVHPQGFTKYYLYEIGKGFRSLPRRK